MMINAIIFSQDKAPRLRMLLESITKNATDVFNLTVIYTSSNSEFDNGYEKLKTESMSAGVKWIQQTAFKNNVLQALQTNADYSCFLMDDDVMYGKLDGEKLSNAMKADQDILCFSLRLGMNTKFCDRLKTGNNLQGEEHIDGTVKWDWTKNYLDYGYPFCLNGNLFRTRDIMKLTKQVGFKNPEEFEEALQIFDTFPKFKMASYETSVLVNVIYNTVNAKTFNEEYLAGNNVSFESINLSNVFSCNHYINPIQTPVENAG
jgi:hypothetical protein